MNPKKNHQPEPYERPPDDTGPGEETERGPTDEGTAPREAAWEEGAFAEIGPDERGQGDSRAMIFRDRTSAGQMLAAELLRYRDEAPIVLGLPRGGVPVAYEVARALGAPLDVWVVRKIGAPVQPELGVGAVAETGELVLHRDTMALAGVSEEEAQEIAREQKAEIDRRVRRFRRGRPPPDVQGRTVIVVDDGIATGGTVQAALRSLRRLRPKKLVLAVPVAATDTLEKLESEADEITCLESVRELYAIGLFYVDFTQTTDDDVVELLRRAGEPAPSKVA